MTNACNLNCSYCYVKKDPSFMTEEVGIKAIDTLINTAREEGYRAIKLKFAGGEPTLIIGTVLKLHDYATQRCEKNNIELFSVLLTNGVTLNTQVAKEIKGRNMSVMVSLDSIDDSDCQRPLRNGKSSNPFVLRGIEKLISNGVLPNISITITDKNSTKIADVVRYALDRNLKFSLNFFRSNDVASRNSDIGFSERVIIEGMESAYKAIEERIPEWSVVGSILDRGQLIEPHNYVCGAGLDYLAIDHLGRISKCHMELAKKIGDIQTSTNLIGLIKSSTIGLKNLDVMQKEGCKDCKWRYNCNGGCPIATFRATGRYDIKSPNCNIYKTIYPLAVRLEGLRLLKYAN